MNGGETRQWSSSRPPITVLRPVYFPEAGVSLVIWGEPPDAGEHYSNAADRGPDNAGRRSLTGVEHEIASVKEIFRLQNAEELAEAELRYLPGSNIARSD